MRECALPNGSSRLSSRTLVACVAAMLEVDVESVPCEPEGDPWPRLNWWLATRGLAVVPVLDVSRFQWSGWWIARRAPTSTPSESDHVLLAGTPSGIVWEPAGPSAEPRTLVEGWVIARPEVTVGGAFPAASSRRQGTVVALFRAPAADAPMEALTEARLLAGVGLEGDRYALGLGRFASVGRAGQALTLIEAEALEALRLEHGLELAPGASRRNVVTRGIDLNAMRGRRFRLGEVECLGQRLADPCSWLQRTTPPGTLRALVSRGGLRADLVTGGVVRVGDVIEVLDEEPARR